MVHRAERHLWPARSQDGRDRGVRRPARHRPLWYRHHARWPSILRLARRQLSRPDQSRYRHCRFDSKTKTRGRWHLPGDGPQPYTVYVDETDAVWVSDWGANAILRFDPKTEKFDSFPLPDRYAGVRQLAGRKGEVWGAESGADKLFVLKTE